MHELSITQEILNIALEKAKEAEANRICQINLVIGEISSVVDDCVQYYFDFISRDTIANGAKLNFRRIPLQVKCRICGNEFSPSEEPWKCTVCQQWDAEIIGGNEFYMESIEVE